ncbi:MAG: hypothetical protein HKM00_02670 [Gallionella sp.]|nr:hypothetical protein [Gallionella sp.]
MEFACHGFNQRNGGLNRLEFVARLPSIILTSTVFGVIIGTVVGAVGAEALKATGAIGMGAIIGAVGGGLFGFSRGKERAFKLKLEAQVALCQAQIEKHISVKQS